MGTPVRAWYSRPSFRWFYTALFVLEVVEAWVEYQHHRFYLWRLMLLLGFFGTATYAWIKAYQQRGRTK